jgi:uncharacterized protein YbbC (DUF1343 family)
VSFTPNGSIYANQACNGLNILVTDRNALDGPELGLEIASALATLFPTQYKLAGLDSLMVSEASFDEVGKGIDPRRIAEQWQDQIDQFESRREKYLIY